MLRRIAGLTAFLMLAILVLPSAAGGADLGKGVATATTEAPEAAAALPDEVLDVVWEWIWFGDGAEQFDVDEPQQYTVQFFADGSVAVQADCNRGRAEYTLGPDGQISLSPVATTMMLCPEGSLDGRFVAALDQVVLFFQMDGDFFLEAPISSGTLRFRRSAS